MHIANFGLVGNDDASAVFQAAQEHLVWMKIGRRHFDSDRRRPGHAPDLERNGAADLAAERGDRLEWPVVRRQDFVADQDPGAMRRGAVDHSGYEHAALAIGFGEHANSRIGYAARGEDPIEAVMLEPACENVGELVIGRFVRRVVMRVRGAELAQHRIDRRRRVFTGARGCGLRAEAGALFLPVETIEAGIVKAVAHQLPDLVEVRLI